MGQMCPCLGSPRTGEEQEKPKTRNQGVSTDQPSVKPKKHRSRDQYSGYPAGGGTSPESHHHVRAMSHDRRRDLIADRQSQFAERQSQRRRHHSSEKQYRNDFLPVAATKQKRHSAWKTSPPDPEKEVTLHHERHKRRHYGGTDAIAPNEVRRAIENAQNERKYKEAYKKEAEPKGQETQKQRFSSKRISTPLYSSSLKPTFNGTPPDVVRVSKRSPHSSVEDKRTERSPAQPDKSFQTEVKMPAPTEESVKEMKTSKLQEKGRKNKAPAYVIPISR